ncbi:MAG: hypothetical protein DWQ34_26440 [Planctomycetota bacterium]|nr:MAG: hypothetical protein DWQ29_16555 [Planctomycetota bacterium]REJ86888.1 MAG: hypothetical protein DWQ34_26440 [Planctomycetota bacterium]REK22849.1 MAG: hypothetical protein DWQ41_18345 [Planctomycetota bacterium]REK33877.1 MAG: hypothetical protein DWQ45_14650 [Planctomycetota bacterium]
MFRKNGDIDRDPPLVLFRERVRSVCGFSSAAGGPFYCPADVQVYLARASSTTKAE